MVKSVIPTTLKEALELLNSDNYKLVSGGTDMLIQNHARTPLQIAFKNNVMYIANLEELIGISEDEENIYIGACTPLESIMEHSATPKLLKETILEMASPAIRHTGTLGGNIGNASPAGDSLVTLYLLDTLVELMSVEGKRVVLLKDFIQGVRKIDLNPNELITKVIVKKVPLTKSEFIKVGPRRSDAISKLSFAYLVSLDENIVKDFRVAFGAVNITVVRNRDIEKKYINKTIEELKDSVDEIIEDYSPFIRPIDDQRSNKVYRKQVCINLIRKFIQEL